MLKQVISEKIELEKYFLPLAIFFVVLFLPQIACSESNFSFEQLREQLKVDIHELDEMFMEIRRIYGTKYEDNDIFPQP